MEVSDQRHIRAALPRTQNPGSNWIVRLTGPKDSLDVFEKRKFSSFYHDSNPGPSNALFGLYTDRAITVVEDIKFSV